MSASDSGHNAYDLLCPNENCKVILLKAGKAKLEHIEKDHVDTPTNSLPHVLILLCLEGDAALPDIQVKPDYLPGDQGDLDRGGHVRL